MYSSIRPHQVPLPRAVFLRLVAAVPLLMLLVAAGAASWLGCVDVDRAVADDGATARSLTQARVKTPGAVAKRIDVDQEARARMPAALRAAVRTALASDRYAVRPAGRHAAVAGSYLAANPAQKLHFGCSGQGVHVRPADPAVDWDLGLSLCGIGYGDLMHATSGGSLQPSGDRIDYRRVTATGKSINEWYVHTTRGVE